MTTRLLLPKPSVRLLALVASLLLLLHPTAGHESCCKHKLLLQEQQKQLKWIPDPNDRPPLIDKPDDIKPQDWDDEDDGEWAPAQIEDPKYQRRLVRNPNYVTFWDKLETELFAALPWVTLGVVVTGALSCLSLAASIPGLLMASSRSNLLLAALLGLATPLCSCGGLPLCVGLVHSGVPLAQVMAFLTASQSAGLDSAAVTYGLLGGTALAARLLGAILLALAVGMVCLKSRKNSSKSKSNNSATCHATTPSSSTLVLPTILSTCTETAVEIYPTVLAGLALSTAALHYLPSLTSYTSTTTTGMMRRALLLAAAMPLQLCEHTSVTLAGAIQKAGGSPGLAFALLLSAPATNLPTLLFVSQQQGLSTALQVSLVLLVTAVTISGLVDVARLDLLADKATGEMAALPNWWIQSSPYLAVALFLVGFGQKILRGKEKDDCCADKSKAKVE